MINMQIQFLLTRDIHLQYIIVTVGFHIPRSLGLLSLFSFHTNPFRIRCPTPLLIIFLAENNNITLHYIEQLCNHSRNSYEESRPGHSTKRFLKPLDPNPHLAPILTGFIEAVHSSSSYTTFFPECFSISSHINIVGITFTKLN